MAPGLRWARGIIAIGNVATGLVALGGVSAGLLSLGGASLGLLLALGGVALGGSPSAQWPPGLHGLGRPRPWLAKRGAEWPRAPFALGGVAVGSKVAIGGVASAPVAIGAAVEGVQTFPIPKGGLSGGQLDMALNAVRAASQGAPNWLCHLLELFITYY